METHVRAYGIRNARMTPVTCDENATNVKTALQSCEMVKYEANSFCKCVFAFRSKLVIEFQGRNMRLVEEERPRATDSNYVSKNDDEALDFSYLKHKLACFHTLKINFRISCLTTLP